MFFNESGQACFHRFFQAYETESNFLKKDRLGLGQTFSFYTGLVWANQDRFHQFSVGPEPKNLCAYLYYRVQYFSIYNIKVNIHVLISLR